MINDLLSRSDIWLAGKGIAQEHVAGLSTHFSQLNKALPFGGWPCGALTEIVTPVDGSGEMQLIFPTLVQASQKNNILLVGFPYLPYLPSFAAAGVNTNNLLYASTRSKGDTLWVMEQALKAKCFQAVIGWPGKASLGELRRLQLAAEDQCGLAFIIRKESEINANTAAPLRLFISRSQPASLSLNITKCRGGVAPKLVHLELKGAPYNQMFCHSPKQLQSQNIQSYLAKSSIMTQTSLLNSLKDPANTTHKTSRTIDHLKAN